MERAAASTSTSPYRDGAIGMAERCAELEAEIKMLRSTIRALSAKNAAPRAVRRVDEARRSSRRVEAVALLITGALVGAFVALVLVHLLAG